MNLNALTRIKILIEWKDVLEELERELYNANGVKVINYRENETRVDNRFVALVRNAAYNAVKAKIAEIDEELKTL